jgi:hypothetical protein
MSTLVQILILRTFNTDSQAPGFVVRPRPVGHSRRLHHGSTDTRSRRLYSWNGFLACKRALHPIKIVASLKIFVRSTSRCPLNSLRNLHVFGVRRLQSPYLRIIKARQQHSPHPSSNPNSQTSSTNTMKTSIVSFLLLLVSLFTYAAARPASTRAEDNDVRPELPTTHAIAIR